MVGGDWGYYGCWTRYLFAVLNLLVMGALGPSIALVQQLECLQQVGLESGQRRTDGGRSEAVRQQAEVGQAALDGRFQAGGGAACTQGRPVLCHQVHKLFADLPVETEGVGVHFNGCERYREMEVHRKVKAAPRQ